MQIEAVYENGKLQFSKPIQLKKKRLKVMVLVPDEEIEDNVTCSKENTSATGKKFDAILGKYRGSGEYVSPGWDKEMWHNHLEKKYLKCAGEGSNLYP